MTSTARISKTLNRKIEQDASSEKISSIFKTRVQIDLSPRALERLNELKRKTDAASYAEVIKNALKVYDGLIEECEKGSDFFVKDTLGNSAPFRIFL